MQKATPLYRAYFCITHSVCFTHIKSICKHIFLYINKRDTDVFIEGNG